MGRIEEGFEEKKRGDFKTIHYGIIIKDLDMLYEFAKGCKSIAEFGVRHVVSAYAWLMARPEKLLCVDIKGYEEFKLLRELAEEANIDLTIMIEDDLKVDIQDVDLLFLDSKHTYDHLFSLLEKHAENVNKYIIIHDTKNQNPQDRACDDFLKSHPEWKRVTNESVSCTVFERVSS